MVKVVVIVVVIVVVEVYYNQVFQSISFFLIHQSNKMAFVIRLMI